MIELHLHTTLGVGTLPPAAALRRARLAGCRFAAITDQADISTMEGVISAARSVCDRYALYMDIDAATGVELTHVPPQLMGEAVQQARALGARIVLAHGENIDGSVAPGTNLAAIEAGVDILAHPGLITLEEANLAAEKGVLLEISCLPRHALANGRVAAMARQTGAGLVIALDARDERDFLPAAFRKAVGLGAGMTSQACEAAFANARALAQKCIRP